MAEVTADTTIEVTVDDENARVNRKLRTIEDLDLMEKGDGGDSDEEGFQLDYHNDALTSCVKLPFPGIAMYSSSLISRGALNTTYLYF